MAPAFLRRKMSFEILLPKIVRRSMLKPMHCFSLLRNRLNQPMSMQDICDGAGSNLLFQGKRVGIPSCATKSVATDAAVVPESHLPAASAGA